MNRYLKTWWNRTCGGRDVMAIGLPMVISTGSFVVMMFVDRMFLLWHLPDEMSAAMPAGMTYWTMICFPLGVASYVSTFVAQYHGARCPESIGRIVWQGVYVALLAIPFFALMWPAAPHIFGFFDHVAVIQTHEINYFRTLIFGAVAGVMAGSLSAFFIGRGKTQIVMYVNIVCTLINLALDAVMIFGLGGFPEWGIVGAAVATVISLWLKIATYLILMHRGSNIRTYRLDRRHVDWSLVVRLFRYGGPNGLHFLIEGAAFSSVMLFLGRLGTDALAATTLAFNINSVAFVPMIGVSIAVSTLVGQQIMQDRADLAARATWTAVVLGLLYSGSFALFYVLCPNLFMIGHAAGMDAAEFENIRATTVVLLRFVAAYCLFDTMQIIFVGAIKGAGDMLFVLLNTIVISTLCITVGVIGANHYRGDLLFWWWSVITGLICALALTYAARFVQGRWRTMSVIEPGLPGEVPLEAAAEAPAPISMD